MGSVLRYLADGPAMPCVASQLALLGELPLGVQHLSDSADEDIASERLGEELYACIHDAAAGDDIGGVT